MRATSEHEQTIEAGVMQQLQLLGTDGSYEHNCGLIISYFTDFTKKIDCLFDCVLEEAVGKDWWCECARLCQEDYAQVSTVLHNLACCGQQIELVPPVL